MKIPSSERFGRVHLCSAAVLVVLLAALYYSTFTWLVTVDWIREDYSSSALVPVVAAYLVYERRKALARTPLSPTWKGLLPIGVGLLLFLVGQLAGEFFTLYISFWLVLAGIVWCWGGTPLLKVLSFPLLFLLGMFPLPNFLNGMITLRLKLLSSAIGVRMIQLSGLSAYREGNVIDLGFTQLQVVDACSGLRYFIPLIVLALLVANYYRAPLWKRGLFVLSAVPISVLTNGLRIASVGILYQFFGPMVAEGFFHDFSGWFIFMLSFALLVAEMRLLVRWFPDPVAEEPGAGEGAQPVESRVGNGIPRQAVACAVLLLLWVVVGQGLETQHKVPPARPFVQFPMQIGGWSGARSSMDPAYLKELDLDEYVMADYRDGAGKGVSFYTAYYGSQSKGQSIHSPSSCLPGNGWIFNDSGPVTVPLAGTATMPVSRAYMQKDSSRQLTYFWFPKSGRIITDPFRLKLYTLWDSLTRRRSDAALVRVITPIYDSEQLPDAEARLQKFTRTVVPVLATFLPR